MDTFYDLFNYLSTGSNFVGELIGSAHLTPTHMPINSWAFKRLLELVLIIKSNFKYESDALFSVTLSVPMGTEGVTVKPDPELVELIKDLDGTVVAIDPPLTYNPDGSITDTDFDSEYDLVMSTVEPMDSASQTNRPITTDADSGDSFEYSDLDFGTSTITVPTAIPDAISEFEEYSTLISTYPMGDLGPMATALGVALTDWEAAMVDPQASIIENSDIVAVDPIPPSGPVRKTRMKRLALRIGNRRLTGSARFLNHHYRKQQKFSTLFPNRRTTFSFVDSSNRDIPVTRVKNAVSSIMSTLFKKIVKNPDIVKSAIALGLSRDLGKTCKAICQPIDLNPADEEDLDLEGGLVDEGTDPGDDAFSLLDPAAITHCAPKFYGHMLPQIVNDALGAISAATTSEASRTTLITRAGSEYKHRIKDMVGKCTQPTPARTAGITAKMGQFILGK